MGATTFSVAYPGSDCGATFDRAQRHETQLHGTNGYSGSLAEKHGYVILASTPLSKRAALLWADQCMDDPRVQDKWGPAGAIPYFDADETPIVTRTVRKTLTVPGPTGDGFWSEDAAIVKAALESVPTKAGERVTRVITHKHTLFPEGGGYSFEGNPELPEPTRKWKTDVVSNPGKAVTKYFVTGGHRPGRSPEWGSGFATLAVARAALKDALAASTEPDAQLGVVAHTRREDGAELVQGTRRLVKVTVTVDVVVDKFPAPPANLPIDGWVFFGWAPC